MPLISGARLGPYEITAPIGAGGMGEVYKARDTRLERDVAVKILPAAFAADAERLRRFEQEARAAGALNHPNILTIYDIGSHDGSPYVVSELLVGEPLDEVMRAGALPRRKAIDYAVQIARGLAAAHQKGIVHRDLKPPNVFVLTDGRAKILDFGLAKLMQPVIAAADKTSAPTVAAATEPGVVMGTVGYMSPEQVRARPSDHRTDIFSFGVVLYEMLAGKRCFQGASGIETMNAILKEDPPPLENRALDRIVRRCLEKNPEERFQSAQDLAFDLESAADAPPTEILHAAEAPPRPHIRRRAVAASIVIACAAVAFFAGRRTTGTAPVNLQQLTFRSGNIFSARIAPDGNTIVYGAAWEGGPVQLYSARPGSSESRSLGLSADVLSVSGSGEMAISVGRHYGDGWTSNGNLARAPLAGGAPRMMLENVQDADWAPDGSLAIVRDAGGRYRLEFPPGKVLYETSGFITHPRISPDGARVAFIDHPLRPDDAGLIAVVDRAGKKSQITGPFASAQGLAWTPRGDEIWFTASDLGYSRALRGVTLGGRARIIAQMAGALVLHDIARDGRVLIAHERIRMGVFALPPGQSKERELTWLDASLAMDLSADGKSLLITEEGSGAGKAYNVYLRNTDGSDAVRLGDGVGIALSPDGKLVAGFTNTDPPELILHPTGAGEDRRLPRHGLVSYAQIRWFRDNQRLLFTAAEAGQAMRVYMQSLGGEKPRAVIGEVGSPLVLVLSPDERLIAYQSRDGKLMIHPLEGGQPREVPGVGRSEAAIRWTADGKALFVTRSSEVPARIYRVDIETGKRQVWRTLMPAETAGITTLSPVQITPDGSSYAYTYMRALSDLYLVAGWK